MIFRCLATPIIGAEVKFHWFTEVFVSFRQPIRDFIVTVRYYYNYILGTGNLPVY